MSSLHSGTRIPIHIASPTLFLPQDPEVPIILVGPGTGVAPMRAFVEIRVRQGAAKSECFPLFHLHSERISLTNRIHLSYFFFSNRYFPLFWMSIVYHRLFFRIRMARVPRKGRQNPGRGE